MPLSSVNYSGGIIITDWYTDEENIDESVKISIRFLTNEIRSDALDIKVFYKKCNQIMNCKINQNSGTLVTELKKKIEDIEISESYIRQDQKIIKIPTCCDDEFALDIERLSLKLNLTKKEILDQLPNQNR